MPICTIYGNFTYKMKSGQEVEFSYCVRFFGVSDHRVDEVEDACPSWGEEVPQDELENEQEAIEEAALKAATEKFKEEYPGGN